MGCNGDIVLRISPERLPVLTVDVGKWVVICGCVRGQQLILHHAQPALAHLTPERPETDSGRAGHALRAGGSGVAAAKDV